jgi:Ca2+-binding RTX toxin-like protein
MAIIHGTEGDDSGRWLPPYALSGTPDPDVIYGYGGRDVVWGNGGDDEIYGGNDNDSLHGGEDGDRIYGGQGVDVITGDVGDDELFGEEGDDFVYAGLGNDRLDGGTGADYMQGDDGDDTYYVDHTGDLISEFSGEGEDWVFSSITTTLTANTEVLALLGQAAINGTGNVLDNGIAGNDAANVLSGGDGNDEIRGWFGNDTIHGGGHNDGLSGDWGDDTLHGDWGADFIFGGSGQDQLFGGSGADWLEGGSDNDVMEGGINDDTYVVDSAGDVVMELPGEGTDTVVTHISYTLPAHVENLTIASGGNLHGTGNGLDNAIVGGGGDNTLRGYAGNDTLIGDAGNDFMSGGPDNDTYYVESAGDVVAESQNEGVDTVNAGVSFTLPVQVENLTLSGSDPLNGIGNGHRNVIAGNAGNNVLRGEGDNDTLNGQAGADDLHGGIGTDTLTGGSGTDDFVFDTTITKIRNVDLITDFSVADDTILLDDAVFSTLPAGALAASRFYAGSAARDADHRIIYDPQDGALLYDADGGGSVAPIQFARLDAGLALTHQDFVVF